MKLSDKYRWYADMIDEYGDNLEILQEGNNYYTLNPNLKDATHYGVDVERDYEEIPETYTPK